MRSAVASARDEKAGAFFRAPAHNSNCASNDERKVDAGMADTKSVVPLDGSELAEIALEEALILGKALKSEVIFLQAIPLPDDVIREGVTTISVDEQWNVRKQRALHYLDSIRNRPEWRDLATAAVVEIGNPAETILDYCRQHKIARIVMATHGRTGVRRWAFGSVAEKVLRAADRTVVIVRAGRSMAGMEAR